MTSGNVGGPGSVQELSQKRFTTLRTIMLRTLQVTLTTSMASASPGHPFRAPPEKIHFPSTSAIFPKKSLARICGTGRRSFRCPSPSQCLGSAKSSLTIDACQSRPPACETSAPSDASSSRTSARAPASASSRSRCSSSSSSSASWTCALGNSR